MFPCNRNQSIPKACALNIYYILLYKIPFSLSHSPVKKNSVHAFRESIPIDVAFIKACNVVSDYPALDKTVDFHNKYLNVVEPSNEGCIRIYVYRSTIHIIYVCLVWEFYVYIYTIIRLINHYCRIFFSFVRSFFLFSFVSYLWM